MGVITLSIPCKHLSVLMKMLLPRASYAHVMMYNRDINKLKPFMFYKNSQDSVCFEEVSTMLFNHYRILIFSVFKQYVFLTFFVNILMWYMCKHLKYSFKKPQPLPFNYIQNINVCHI